MRAITSRQLVAAKGKFAGVKIKCGASPASDVARVQLRTARARR